MFLPWLEGIRFIFRAPITWLLILANTLVWGFTSSYQAKTKKQLEAYYDRSALIRAQGEVFAEFITQHPDKYSELFLKLSDLALAGNRDQTDLLGRLALRDYYFLEESASMQFKGDDLLFDFWKTEFNRIKKVFEDDPVTEWGLGHRDASFSKWISYQFLHGGAFHLFSNMWFLLIFGSALEPLLGSAWFLLLYLCSGLTGAWAYIELSGLTGVPLVGASGAISGLMGLYVGMHWKEKVRFMYWLLPIKGYTGFILLPAWVLLVVWSVSDLAGYFGTIREIGGIAHAAHIGGAGIGLILGYFFRVWRKSSSHRIFGHAPRL